MNGYTYLGNTLLGYYKSVITFTFFYIDGNSIEISIPAGMTWDDFIESNYNGIYVEDWEVTLTFHEDENSEGSVAVNDESGDPLVSYATSGGEQPENADYPTLSTVIEDGDYYIAIEYVDPGGGEDPGGGDGGGDE